MFKFKKYKKGFTLVEVIIAMVLISGTVAIFSKVAYAGLKAGNKNKQSLEAVIIGQNYLEKIRAARDNNDIYNEDALKKYIINLGFEASKEKFVKEEIKDSIKYNTNITINKKEESDSIQLMEVIIEVKPKDSNSSKLGTTIIVKKSSTES